jgi:hypothetical protein
VLPPTKQPIKHFGVFVAGFDVFDLAHVVGKGASGSLDAREQTEKWIGSFEVGIWRWRRVTYRFAAINLVANAVSVVFELYFVAH